MTFSDLERRDHCNTEHETIYATINTKTSKSGMEWSADEFYWPSLVSPCCRSLVILRTRSTLVSLKSIAASGPCVLWCPCIAMFESHSSSAEPHSVLVWQYRSQTWVKKQALYHNLQYAQLQVASINFGGTSILYSKFWEDLFPTPGIDATVCVTELQSTLSSCFIPAGCKMFETLSTIFSHRCFTTRRWHPVGHGKLHFRATIKAVTDSTHT